MFPARSRELPAAALVAVALSVSGCMQRQPAPAAPARGQSAATATTRPATDESLLRTRGQAQGTFFTRLGALCGQRFPGRAVFTSMPDDPMARARLVMHVERCSGEEIRVPFLVDEDRSRTWVVTLHPGALQLKHDHRHADGTPDDITMYGGWATSEGSTGWRQRFPADSQTAALIPAAVTNVWTLEIDEAQGKFIYDLQRDGRPRFRAEFDLRAPMAAPR